MNVKPGDVAIIVGGPPLNLGKLVYVLGKPDDPRMPSLGERKGPRMGVQMSANPLIATDGEEVFGGSLEESCLVSLGVHGERSRIKCHDANSCQAMLNELRLPPHQARMGRLTMKAECRELSGRPVRDS